MQKKWSALRSGKKVRISIGNIDLFAHYSLILFSKLGFHTEVGDYFHGNNRKFPYEKLTFFRTQAIPKSLFLLDSRYTGDTPYGVWFDLDNSLTP